jgi:hypothetical protein
MKRVTLPITPEIEMIQNRLKQGTGISMTYVQVIDYLAHFYLDRKDEEAITPVQVDVYDFLDIVSQREDVVGNPIIWAEWPTKAGKA